MMFNELRNFWRAADALNSAMRQGQFDPIAYEEIEIIALNSDWDGLVSAANRLLASVALICLSNVV